jgi:hypothetical protein
MNAFLLPSDSLLGVCAGAHAKVCAVMSLDKGSPEQDCSSKNSI